MLIRPAPFPEEVDRGYLGRVMRLNGKQTEKDAVTLISIWAGVDDKSRREVSCLELLSKVAGMALPLFVRQHSTLPLRRGITSYQPDLPHGSEDNRSMLWTTGMRLARTEAYFCAKCVHEDQMFHGQSYWRREHQIPGLMCCTKHSTPIKYVENKSAFLMPPSEYLHICQSVDEAWAQASLENKYIQRYLEICYVLLGRDAPLEVKHVAAILKAKASDFGFQTHGGSVKAPLLSDAVVEAFGRKWLSTVLPALADKPARKLMSQLDGVLFLMTSASSVSAYVLACAVLFESADIALNALQLPQAKIKESRRPSSQIDRDELLAAYIQARGNYSTTSSLISASKPKVIAGLRAIGLPNLIESAKQSTWKAAFAFFIEKQSLIQSSAIGGISVEAMENLLRTSGCGLANALQKMERPTGLGTGVRRARKLTPEEALTAKEKVAVKFSTSFRPEQLRAFQSADMDVQNVDQ